MCVCVLLLLLSMKRSRRDDRISSPRRNRPLHWLLPSTHQVLSFKNKSVTRPAAPPTPVIDWSHLINPTCITQSFFFFFPHQCVYFKTIESGRKKFFLELLSFSVGFSLRLWAIRVKHTHCSFNNNNHSTSITASKYSN